MVNSDKKIFNNTIMLMIFQISKIVFPFVTLPYLTRVLSTEVYGSVTYVKTVMNYMQILVDFGFVLSATKAIVNAKKSKDNIEYIIGDTLIARIILGIFGFALILALTICLPILRVNILYTMLSYIVVFESIFLMDFLFRGIEKMHIITIRFIVMRTISVVFTFFLIKNDNDMLLIPILDIISSTIAIALVFLEMRKMKISMKFSTIKKTLQPIKESFIYFLSNVASTSFNAFSTIVIGIYINATEVAYWGLCMQIIGSIQACYTPISEGIYPEMIRNKKISLIKKIVKILLPIVVIGCIFAYILAPLVFTILGGEEYLKAVPTFRILIPTLFFGFLAIILGWPTLGAIGKHKETTLSTISSIVLNITLIVILIITDSFTIVNIAIVRVVTEIMLFATRYYFFNKYKYLFSNQ